MQAFVSTNLPLTWSKSPSLVKHGENKFSRRKPPTPFRMQYKRDPEITDPTTVRPKKIHRENSPEIAIFSQQELEKLKRIPQSSPHVASGLFVPQQSIRLMLAVEVPTEAGKLITKIRNEFRLRYVEEERLYEDQKVGQWPIEKERLERGDPLVFWRRDPSPLEEHRWKLVIKHVGQAPNDSILALQTRLQAICDRLKSFDVFVDSYLSVYPNKNSSFRDVGLTLSDRANGLFLVKLHEAIECIVSDWMDYDVPYYGEIREPNMDVKLKGNVIEYYEDIPKKRLQLAKMDYYAAARERSRVYRAVIRDRLKGQKRFSNLDKHEFKELNRFHFSIPSISLFRRVPGSWEKLSEHPVIVSSTVGSDA